MKSVFKPELYFAGDPAAKSAFERMSPLEQQQLAAIIRTNGDRRGNNGEVTTPPTRGSRKHMYA